MDFLPINKIHGSSDFHGENNIYNLFQGYNPLILNGYNKEKRKDILEIFKILGTELCGGNEEHFQYFLKFIAHMIQKPRERLPIAFIIKGKQGTGKNVFLQAICNLLDKRNYICSSNPNDFFGEYAEGFHHKMLVNINECEGKDTFDFEGRLKSFITESTITLNVKFMRPIVIQNFARLIIFSNKSTPIPIDVRSGDRRYVVFKTTDTFLDKKKYSDLFWTKLVKYFESPTFLSALYDELNEMNIDDFEFVKRRPITEAYLEMCKSFIPPMALFFENLIDTKYFNMKEEVSENGQELYLNYKDWIKIMGFNKDFEPSIKNFYSSISELDLPIVKYKKLGTNYIKFLPFEMNRFLLEKGWCLFETKVQDNYMNEEEKEDLDIINKYLNF
jgi:phage/plasmid-associated DNA primase